jgi:predicted hotdog family 3-hydroxylacyl-ACP dehydratase
MKLDRATIERLVPHSGAMCLLGEVTQWGAGSIECTAPAPGADHPLRRHAAVPAIAACEYAAQAAAVHGALLDQALSPRPGMLVKLMDVDLHARSFPDGADLRVSAQLVSRVSTGCLYSFDVRAGSHAICEGKLMVAFGAAS